MSHDVGKKKTTTKNLQMLHGRISQPEQVDGLHRKTLALLPYMESQHCSTKEVEMNFPNKKEIQALKWLAVITRLLKHHHSCKPQNQIGAVLDEDQ